MLPPMPRRALLLIACLLLGACLNERQTLDGVLVMDDGRIVAATPQNARRQACARLERLAAQNLGPGRAARVVIEELPERRERAPAGNQWFFPSANATVTVDGAPAPTSEEGTALAVLIRDALAGQVRAGARIHVQVRGGGG